MNPASQPSQSPEIPSDTITTPEIGNERNEPNNGPRIASIGLSIAAISFLISTLDEVIDIGLAGVVFLVYLAIPFSICMFIYGVIKSLLFYDALTSGRKSYFIFIVFLAVLLLVGAVIFTNHQNRPSDQYILCGEKYGPVITDTDAYYACLRND